MTPFTGPSGSPFCVERLPCSRREFLYGLTAGASLWGLPGSAAATPQTTRPKVAAVFTVFNHRSHAHVILENFLESYLFNGKLSDPGVDVVAFYADQLPGNDMARDVAKQYGIPLFKTINEALCVGGDSLNVDAVLSIGEHGNYPVNALGQRQYPRKRFFDAIVDVMRRSNRFVPVFNDKHLSYRWDWSKEMYETAKRHHIPLMAGSSVPLAQRRPELELPLGAEIQEAVSIHGGPIESYDFHGLEVLQSMIESRSGGETGIASVEFLSGDALWKAADQGRWSRELATAAMAAELGKAPETLTHVAGEQKTTPHGLLLKYTDGLRASVLKIGHNSTRWNFACRLKNTSNVKATSFYVGPWQNRNLFKALSHAIQQHFIHKRAPYPVERTLLVTGILESAMQSRRDQGAPTQTPHLNIAYKARDFAAMRERGASWKIITEGTPEPRGINPNGGTTG